MLIIWLFMVLTPALSFRCDRRPYGAISQSSVPDGRFVLEIVDAEETYLPEQLYTVKITRTDEESYFTAFMISAEGDIRVDPYNPRRMVALNPGAISPIDPDTAKYNQRCHNTVEQAMSSPKESVEVYWRAPPSGSGCVTLRAMVAENEDLWYEDGAPLSKRLCEDLSQPDDVTPVINDKCGVCDEAKYEITFTGIWSRNTHPVLYPENDWLPRFSDLVGASHSADYVLWSPGLLATDGLKDLAEYANSSKLEKEIREKIGDGVRTMIKGKGHGNQQLRSPSYSYFRADKIHHLVTVAVGLFPSPDWFLGVTRFELCTAENTWLEERELNLYPWDAGTDSGVSYESINIPTYPQDAIDRVQMRSPDKNSPFYDTDMRDLHPFGKLHLRLVRTYQRICEDSTEEGETPAPDEGGEGSEEHPEPDEPSRYQTQATRGGREGEAPMVLDPESPEECPMTQWTEWSPCEGVCVNGRAKGYRWRERYHMVDGKIVEKYDPDNPDAKGSNAAVPDYCKNHYDEFDQEKCDEDCEAEEETKVERRIMTPVLPGHGWRSKKRELNESLN